MSNGSQIGGVVGAVVGGVIGYFAGGNVAAGAQWGYAIGSAVGGYIDPTKTQGPRLTDASQQTSTVGGIIPFGYGTFTVSGNIIWADELKEHKKTERVGKGGSEKLTTFTYTRSYAIGVCEQINKYVWIKKNGKLAYAADPAALGLAMGWTNAQITDLVYASAEFLKMATLYYGTDTQMPDSTIVAVEGVGNVSPFRDLAYIVIENEDLTDTQGAVSQYEFCVFAAGVGYATSPPYVLESTETFDTDVAPLALGNITQPYERTEFTALVAPAALEVREMLAVEGTTSEFAIPVAAVELEVRQMRTVEGTTSEFTSSADPVELQLEQIRVVLNDSQIPEFEVLTAPVQLEVVVP